MNAAYGVGADVADGPYGGEYLVEVYGWDQPPVDGGPSEKDPIRWSRLVAVDDVDGLIRHLLTARERIAQRRVKDAVCGDCAICNNTRMTTKERAGVPGYKHDRSEVIACPRCQPLLAAAAEKGLL